MWSISRYQRADGSKFWMRECAWQRRDGGSPVWKCYQTTKGLKKALRPDGKFLPTERLIVNDCGGRDWLIVWKLRGETREQAFNRAREEKRQREESFRLANEQRIREAQRLDFSGGWE